MRSRALCAVVLLLSGCTQWSGQGQGQGTQQPATIASLTYRAVDRLVDSAGIRPDSRFLVASAANLGDLEQSSDLGRVVSEEAAQRLIQLGYGVPEVRLTDTLHVRQDGEFMLSDEINAIRKVHSADDVLTGTVGNVAGTTYVSLRIVRLTDGVAISAVTFVLPTQPGYGGF